jgi:hypothetical protein
LGLLAGWYVVYMGAGYRAIGEVVGVVADEDGKRAAFRGLVERVLTGDGRASVEERATAFANAGGGGALGELVDKVARRPAEVGDGDFAAVGAAGFSEDQVFELVVCAAVGQADRLYGAGLAALDEATAGGDAAGGASGEVG